MATTAKINRRTSNFTRAPQSRCPISTPAEELARKRTEENAYNATMETLALFLALALPTLAADTTIVGKVVGVHDGDTLTPRTEDETL